jgi:hypothetical protein
MLIVRQARVLIVRQARVLKLQKQNIPPHLNIYFAISERITAVVLSNVSVHYPLNSSSPYVSGGRGMYWLYRCN